MFATGTATAPSPTLGSRSKRCRKRVREFFRDWVSDFDDFRSDVEEWIDAGDTVIAAVRASGRGKKSGIAVDSRDWHAWTLRDGKMWRLRIYDERHEALKAVGVEE